MIDVVIVNWNGRRYLPVCLRALARSAVETRIIVVDNASTDGSADYLRAEHPEVRLLALDENIGYAAGANRGLNEGTAPYAMVMNPDVVLAPDHLAVLQERLDGDDTIGAAQGKLFQVTPQEFESDQLNGAHPIDSAGHVIRRTRMVVDRGQGRADEAAFSTEVSVFSACGAALFLRRAMLEDVAPAGRYFDESFFAYKEDIDLCWRARLLGWDVRYIPQAVAYHVRGWGGARAPQRDRIPAAARRHSWKNHYLLMLKNDRWPDVLRSAPAVLGWELLRQIYAAARDPELYSAYRELKRLLPETLRQRRDIMQRRRASAAEMRAWFGGRVRPVVPR